VYSPESDALKPSPVWANLLAAAIRRMPGGRYRLMHLVSRGRNQTFAGKLPKKFGGCEFECCLRDNIAREVFFTGNYEPQESALIRGILQPGMTFVDAGSNWGFFTLVAAHLVGPQGRVVAIEADPRVFRKLRSNVRRNELRQVQVFDCALADREDAMTLAGHNEADETCGVSRLVENHASGGTQFQVQTRRLDSLLDEAGLEKVDVLKLDVEGAEDMVLAGMQAGLARQRYRCILLELHPVQLGERKRTIDEVMGLLSAQGYKGCALDYSQAAFRRACYDSSLHFSEFIRPLSQVHRDVWPHTIWLAPDYQSSWLDRVAPFFSSPVANAAAESDACA
jgi:FkbM family methyltransferase